MLELLILVVSVIANLIIGALVYIKNPKSDTSKIFGILAFGLSGWSAISYLSVNTGTTNLFLVRLTMFFVVLMNTGIFFLIQTFPMERIHYNKKLKLIAAYCIFTLAVTVSPFLFTHLEISSSGSVAPQPGPGMLFFLGHVVLCVIGGPYLLIRRFKQSKGKLHAQLRFLVIGTLLLFTLLPLTNFIFPLLLKNSAFIILSPLYTALFAACIGYAMIKHKLFDIRSTVARGLVYILSLGSIAIGYGVFVYLLTNILMSGYLSEATQRAFYIGLAVVSSIFYKSVKQFFDKLTNRLFFQDIYSTDDFLDKINKLLVGEIELENLLKGIVAIIEENIKCSYCVFVIRETEYEPLRIIGTKAHHFSQESTNELRKLAPKTQAKLLVTDELDSYQGELRTILRSMDISVLIRLVSTASYDTEGIGYLVVGPKKNGNIYTPQDIQALNILANEMVIAIENALRFEEIEKFNVTLQHKVEEATAQLKRNNQKLKTLDENKDEFISMASHQLRTPLTSVKGYISMVLEGDAGKITEKQRKLLDQAFVSSQRMVYLIADLLNLSRLKTGKFVIDAVPTNLAKVLGDEVQQLKETAASRGLTLNYEKPDSFPVLMLDETKVRQVLMNFMDNAIYYTPTGGEINVALRDTGKTIEFTVTDSGIGVPKSEQPHLFTKFYRAGNAKKARPDGTGLGLFMVRKVIVAQGGSIIFHSKEGKGSTFGFSFEKAKLEVPAKGTSEPDKV